MSNGLAESERIDRKKIYDVLSGMANTASTLADYRFYYYLVANTLLVLAWVELYAMSSCPSVSEPDRLYPLMACLLALLISGFGWWLARVFRRFLKRTKLYERHYIAWAAKMEVDCRYRPKPFLWTGLIRELAEEIDNLDSPRGCASQQMLLRLLNDSLFEGCWVRAKHVLPSQITTSRLGAFEAKDHPVDLYIREYREEYGHPKVAAGTAFKIYSKVTWAFKYIFLVMVVFSLVSVANVVY